MDAIYDDGLSVSSRPIKTTEDATGWLDRLFDGLGLDDGITLMGISFGGWLSAEYLLHAPERLAKVVVGLAGRCGAPMSGEFIARSMMCLIPSERAFRWVTRWIMEDAAEVEPEFFEDAVEEMALSEKCFKFRMWPGGGPRKLSDEELAASRSRCCTWSARTNGYATRRPRWLDSNRWPRRSRRSMIPGAGHDAVWVQTDAVREPTAVR